MARRAGLTRGRVVDAAAQMLDEFGPAGLTLAALATQLGVKTPSLYTHVGGIEDLQRAVRLRVLEELALELQRAAVGRAGRDALRELARAYRAFARRYPGRYLLGLRGSAESSEIGAVAGRILETIAAVLHGYGLEGDEVLHATRGLRSALHGFAALELAGGFAMELDLDASFERYIDMLDAGLAASSAYRGQARGA